MAKAKIKRRITRRVPRVARKKNKNQQPLQEQIQDEQYKQIKPTRRKKKEREFKKHQMMSRTHTKPQPFQRIQLPSLNLFHHIKFDDVLQIAKSIASRHNLHGKSQKQMKALYDNNQLK